MADRKRYFLADATCMLPMPDRDGRPFPKAGAMIDPAHPYYRQAIADGSLVEERKSSTDTVKPKASDTKTEKPAPSKKD